MENVHSRSQLRHWVLAACLTLLGLARIAGDLLGLRPLQGLAAATAASPAPKVFSAVKGLETFSTRFAVEWTDRASGERKELALTPERIAQIRGPYNRRNVYGAVVAYGPVLKDDPVSGRMFDSVATYALCNDAPLLRELGIDRANALDVTVTYRPLRGNMPSGLPDAIHESCP